jgi:hypothetical protein
MPGAASKNGENFGGLSLQLDRCALTSKLTRSEIQRELTEVDLLGCALCSQKETPGKMQQQGSATL